MIRYFAGHPTIANLLMILFLAAGLFVSPGLLRETFPRAMPNEVEVSIPYPGARPEDVESAICERVENAFDAVTGIDRQSCEAREGTARAVVRMREGDDFQAFVADVKAEIDAITDFPDRTEAARVRPLGLTDFVASVAVTGPSSRTELNEYAEEIRIRMLRWGGIPKVDIKGFSTLELQIDLKPEALRQFGVSVSDIARVVEASSLDLPAGSLETSTETLLIRVAEERRKTGDLADLIIRSSVGGGQVRLGDIADINKRFALDDDFVLFDGQPAAVLDITKTRAEDSLRIIDALRAFLEAERVQAPPRRDDGDHRRRGFGRARPPVFGDHQRPSGSGACICGAVAVLRLPVRILGGYGPAGFFHGWRRPDGAGRLFAEPDDHAGPVDRDRAVDG